MPLTEQQRWQIIESRIDKLTMWVAKILRKKMSRKRIKQDIDAIASDVITLVHAALVNYDESYDSNGANLDGYFYSLVQHKTREAIRMHMRKQQKYLKYATQPVELVVGTPHEPATATIPKKCHIVLQNFDEAERYRLLGKLPARKRIALEMWLDNHTFASIAQRLGVDTATAFRDCNSAIETLRVIVANEA